jgi:hypothetical protein
MPDNQRRYRHEDQFKPLDYLMYYKDKLKTLPRMEQDDIKHYQELLISKVPELGSYMAAELILKLGAYLNGVENGK